MRRRSQARTDDVVRGSDFDLHGVVVFLCSGVAAMNDTGTIDGAPQVVFEQIARNRYRFAFDKPAFDKPVAAPRRAERQTPMSRDIGSSEPIDGHAAITIARERFHKLCSEGTLSTTGAPVGVDAGQVELVLGFLRGVGKTQQANMCAIDVQRAIAATGREVSKGAVIAASVACGFTVRTWRGVWDYSPDALINASSRDLRRVIAAGPAPFNQSRPGDQDAVR